MEKLSRQVGASVEVLRRVYVHIRIEDLHLDDESPQIYLTHAKRQACRYVPVLPALAQELRTHLQGRRQGYLFESNRQTSVQPLGAITPSSVFSKSWDEAQIP